MDINVNIHAARQHSGALRVLHTLKHYRSYVLVWYFYLLKIAAVLPFTAQYRDTFATEAMKNRA